MSYSAKWPAADGIGREPDTKRQPPVIDHEAEGDGSDDPTWCYCGRLISEHLRRPR